MTTDEELAGRAAELLGLGRVGGGENFRFLPEDGAVYAWTPGRGGAAVIVAEDGTALFATSAIDFDAHLDAFRSGRRTPPEAFGAVRG